MTEKTATASAAEAVAQAQAELEKATAAHGEAQEASNAARSALAELEAAADRGEAVDTDEYTRRKADLSLKARRTAALAGPVAAAQQALTAAQKAEDEVKLRELIAAIPSTDKARQKVLRSFEEYLAAVKAQDERTLAVYKAADSLPDFPHGKPGFEDATGWPAYAVLYRGQWQMESRIGHLRVDGRRIARPDARKLGEDLADALTRIARTPR